MQRNFLVNLGIYGISALTSVASLTVNVDSTFSQTTTNQTTTNQAKTSPTNSGRVIFKCVNLFDKASDQRVATTVFWIPEKKQHRRLIAWKSEFSRWSPQKRCEAATKKFQKFYDQGTLNYLSTGIYKGYPIICTAQPGESCNKENAIFRIKPGSDPNIVLQRLLDIAESKSSEMIFQNSGKQIYVHVNKFLDQATVVDISR